jgi:stress responsive alpha/beta barrel protein
MFRHVVLFGWTDEATDEQKQRVAEQLGTLPARIPEIQAYHFGADAGVNEGTYDFGVVADFDDVESYRRYRDNAEHRAIIERYIAPLVARRAAIQYEF